MTNKEQLEPKTTTESRTKRCESCTAFFYDRDKHVCFITDEEATSIEVCRMKDKVWK